MKTIQTILLIILAGIVLILGCDKPFDVAQLPPENRTGKIGDTNYVEIVPPWGGFEEPTAILVGNDGLIYVADHEKNEIVMMDIGGTVLMRRSILHPTSLAQSLKLDLYVGAEALAPNRRDTMGIIYKISLVRFDTVNIDTVIDPFTHDTTFAYRDTAIFYNNNLAGAPGRVVWQEIDHPSRRFPGIGVLPDNGYLAARVGPDNSSFVDPDSRVLRFDNTDYMVTSLPDLATPQTIATGITDINQLTGMTTFPRSRDFILLQSSNGASYCVIWMFYQKDANFEGWLPKYNPLKNPADIISYVRFQNPTQVSIDKRRGDIFIVDSELDSVVKFDRVGRFRTESFGKNKSRGVLPGLNHPRGVAFSTDCTLYVCDTGNKLIRRFKISSQTQCY